MAKTDWNRDDTIQPADMNQIGEELNSKLDSSAYTAADVLAKIKTMDGTGSGLDADAVQGARTSVFSTLANTVPVRNEQGIIYANQFSSLIPTGTPPFLVASQTPVPNLNAFMVGGKQASEFVQLASHAKEVKLGLGNTTFLIVNVTDTDNYEISSCLRVVASTNITFYVNFQDAAGGTQKSYIANAQTFVPGYYHMLPVFFNGSQISLVASSSVANVVFISASAVRR